jgi:hypothetical protein
MVPREHQGFVLEHDNHLNYLLTKHPGGSTIAVRPAAVPRRRGPPVLGRYWPCHWVWRCPLRLARWQQAADEANPG